MITEDIDVNIRKKQIYRVTLVGSIANFLLLAFKFAAGIVGHSAAMIADAVHSLSDFVTDIIVLIFVKISSKPSDQDHRYGHGKYETLATAIIAIMLLVVGCGILWDSIDKIMRYMRGEKLDAPGSIALIAALVSIVVKEGLYQYTKIKARHLKSTVVEANAWHHRSDALSSIGTALGIGGAIYFGVKGRVLDPIAALIVSLLIIRVAIKLIGPAINELLERSLPKETVDEIMKAISDIPDTAEAHNLRTRRIGNYAAVDVHVRMNPDMTVKESHDITKQIERRIRNLLGEQTYVNVHVEPKK